MVNYLIENRRAVLPSSATALLYEEQIPRPTPRPPPASIQNPPKEAGQFTVQVVSFVFFYLVYYTVLCFLTLSMVILLTWTCLDLVAK